MMIYIVELTKEHNNMVVIPVTIKSVYIKTNVLYVNKTWSMPILSNISEYNDNRSRVILKNVVCRTAFRVIKLSNN